MGASCCSCWICAAENLLPEVSPRHPFRIPLRKKIMDLRRWLSILLTHRHVEAIDHKDWFCGLFVLVKIPVETANCSCATEYGNWPQKTAHELLQNWNCWFYRRGLEFKTALK